MSPKKRGNDINILHKLPFSASGLMLGIVAMGALIEEYIPFGKLICGGVACLIWILLVSKILCSPKQYLESMKDPVTASVMGTFSMTCMMLSTYVKQYFGGGMWLWYVGVALHLTLAVYFTYNFVWKLGLTKVYASYFIVYSGIAMISVTSPVFAYTRIGYVAVWFAIVPIFCLIPVVTLRYMKYREIAEDLKPLFCVFAAPVNLCLVGYIRTAEKTNMGIVWLLWLTGSMLYLIVLTRLWGLLKLSFYPSYAAFTFPFIVTATATESIRDYTGGTLHTILGGLMVVEIIIAVMLLLYTSVEYARYMIIENIYK